MTGADFTGSIARWTCPWLRYGRTNPSPAGYASRRNLCFSPAGKDSFGPDIDHQHGF